MHHDADHSITAARCDVDLGILGLLLAAPVHVSSVGDSVTGMYRNTNDLKGIEPFNRVS
jgi:hypothetical protein